MSPPPPPAPRVAERVFNALERFMHVEAMSGIVLLVAAAAALFWANSAAQESYHHFWHMPVTVGAGSLVTSSSLHFLINEILMAVFFLVVGMEIRREIHEGALATLRLAALPLAAAVGGVAAPALLFVTLVDSPALLQGWAVPTATDIAFAVGVLALLGRSIPGSVRVFLLALAIIDDIVAVVIIAVFYSEGIQLAGLGLAVLGIGLVLGFQRAGIANAWAYGLPGAVVWSGLLSSGLHPALAGVILGLLTPVRSPPGSELPPPVVRIERALHPWVAYGIMPLFALANAGVTMSGIDLASGASRNLLLATCLALVVGKPFGIALGSLCAVRLGWCQLSPGMSWGHVVLVGTLAGIGFTMAIFIATLAFTEESLLTAAKTGVLLASAIAGLLGLALGLILRRRSHAQ